MKKRHPIPLLLTSHGYENNKQSLYSLIDNRYKTISHPVLEGKRILGSDYGWLVLVDRSPFSDDCCLWNPESTDKIQLPRLDQAWVYSRCVLSKPPIDPDCLVVFKSYCNFELSVCRISDDEFVKVSLRDEIFRPLVAISSFKGDIYGIFKDDAFYELVIVNLVGKTVEFKPLLINGERRLEVPELWRGWIKSHQNYLIESPVGVGVGVFFLVIKMTSDNGVEFKVFRLDVNELVSMEIENLDGHTIFIGSFGDGFCCPSSGTGIKSNSIYYTNISGRVMCVYDLDDRSTTLLLPCPVAGRYKSTNYWVDLPEILRSM
ncbi:hypothetical protein CASFOL_024999 [Castilleja foliolosa]|uniref:KIB1-4 beta-propeller domain-containing protein n=1 Tax=Castilleja foliolosa TaxID=1961234 RepID=A0ABD3CPX4_9LAMI